MGTWLLEASRAVTVILNCAPVVVVAGACMEKCVAVNTLTLIGAEEPVTEEAVVSVTVMVWLPDVKRVTGTVAVPPDNSWSGGNTAWLSLLVKCTVSTKLVARLLEASRALIVMLKAAPAVAVPCALTKKWVAGPGICAEGPDELPQPLKRHETKRIKAR